MNSKTEKYLRRFSMVFSVIRTSFSIDCRPFPLTWKEVVIFWDCR